MIPYIVYCSYELMIAGYVLCSDWRFWGILASLGRTIELLPYDEQAAGQLLSVGAVVSDKKGLVPLTHDESRNVHHLAAEFTHYKMLQELGLSGGPV